MKTLFPRPCAQELQAIMINTSGGITGGDKFSFSACAGEGSLLSLTSQAAERVYKARPDEWATVMNRLLVGARARIDWLPQETILFDACALERQMHIKLEADATLLLVEPLVFGRAAMDETLRSPCFKDTISVQNKASRSSLTP